ncbi:MAG: dehypoxanthine futalosine cyclase [Candidatus Schekmanbacteria bacterium GWA2_38_11]|uniref:Cyclic dehypoxanthine futalosine synthase n=1 Tax=Candidatus Schekmanbacteria bacterium GWA2_38_11 TaxID=1817876 RepID=A0A1F7RB57_9BACT|nr:MAG: dehypoxanthine futalosine cyclase [Candidatus Schekmanbacteria bacterium GWA2_38_11]
MLTATIEKIEKGERLDFEDGINLFKCHDLVLLGRIADNIRKKFHPKKIVTYIIDRNINYTNICIAKCYFCAFYREVGSPEAYLLSEENLYSKIEETLKLGGTQILMQGGLHPDLGISFYENMLRGIKSHYKIHIHAFSPPEIIHIARVSRLPIEETIKRLKEAGLGSIPGGGAEILEEDVRKKISPAKCTAEEWFSVMRIAHKIGLKTSATMMFGHVESLENRIRHILKVRDLQDETAGFIAFIPWTYQPENTRLGGEQSSGSDYLKTLAISRILLDNFKNIQASWVTQGPKIAQIALSFGANDMGSTMIEENVVRLAGACYRMRKEDIEFLIKDSGFLPVQRDTFYNKVGNDRCVVPT